MAKKKKISNAKIDNFIAHCNKDFKTNNLSDLLRKARSDKTKRALRRFSKTSATKQKARKIDGKEVAVIFDVLKGLLNDQIDKNELIDLKLIIGYKHTPENAQEKLVRKILQRKRDRRTRRVRNDLGFKKNVIQVLKSQKSHDSKGFSVIHGGQRFVYCRADFKDIVDRIEDNEIELVSYDYKGEREAIKRRSSGLYISSKDRLLINRANPSWKSTVVHEAVHAIQDVNGIVGRVGDYEVAAHIAQAVRIIKVKGKDYLKSQSDNKVLKRLASEAISDVASKIKDSTEIYEVSKTEQSEVLKVIKKQYGSKIYEKRPATQNENGFLAWWKQIF